MVPVDVVVAIMVALILILTYYASAWTEQTSVNGSIIAALAVGTLLIALCFFLKNYKVCNVHTYIKGKGWKYDIVDSCMFTGGGGGGGIFEGV
jgi:hypothetical protein